MDCLTFHVADAEYAVDLLRIQEVSNCLHVTFVPGVPPAVRGVTSLHGNVVGVVDLAVPFGQRFTPVARHTGLIFVNARFEGQPILVGLIVDSPGRILSLVADEIAPPPNLGPLANLALVCGLAKVEESLVPLLNPDTLLSSAVLRAAARPLHTRRRSAATPAARELAVLPPNNAVTPQRGLSGEGGGGGPSLPGPEPPSGRPTAAPQLLPQSAASSSRRVRVCSEVPVALRSSPLVLGARRFAPRATAAPATSGQGLPRQTSVSRPLPAPGQWASHAPVLRAAPSRRLGGPVGWLLGAGAFLALLALSLPAGRSHRPANAPSPVRQLQRAEFSGTLPRPERLEAVAAGRQPESTTLGSASARPREAPTPFAVHEVQQGDTLWALSRRYYGNPFLWPQIFASNRDQIADPDLISPRERLRIPHRP